MMLFTLTHSNLVAVKVKEEIKVPWKSNQEGPSPEDEDLPAPALTSSASQNESWEELATKHQEELVFFSECPGYYCG